MNPCLFRLFKRSCLISSQHIRIMSNNSLFKHTYYFQSSAPDKVHTEQELNKDVSPEVLRRRLIFRCKNRGIKELDLLMGNWAMEYVNDLSDTECDELQTILNEETLDLVNILLKRADVPENLNNSIMQNMIKWRDEGNITGYAK
mmetsp:Transcript_21771/g.19198  ORF Transcript_21771/g.19198 Transcript_21771/m.19198 type:complete len:145 (-) Transcript_21771:14-448(-)